MSATTRVTTSRRTRSWTFCWVSSPAARRFTKERENECCMKTPFAHIKTPGLADQTSRRSFFLLVYPIFLGTSNFQNRISFLSEETHALRFSIHETPGSLPVCERETEQIIERRACARLQRVPLSTPLKTGRAPNGRAVKR